MSKHNIPENNPLIKYVGIEADDSGSDIVTKMYEASGENLHNIPKDMEDGYNHAYDDGVCNTLMAIALFGILATTIYNAYQSIVHPQILNYKQHKAQKRFQATASVTKQLPGCETNITEIECEESRFTSNSE